jgi:trimethylamine-N-oxide reductase (cytochrome c)
MFPSSNCEKDVAENTDMILFWGSDAETTYPAFLDMIASRELFWYTELGIKSVYVCPDLNYSAAVHADKWIPVLPNTDAALQLAIAYVWITEEAYDKDYVATHTVGFDTFRDYVRGTEDGVPKTPAWASPLCGIKEWTIKALARQWAAKTTSTHHYCGGSFIRGPYSTEPGRLEALLLAMQGLGKPGAHQLHGFKGWPGPEKSPNMFPAMRGNAPLPKQHIAKPLIPEAILNPPLSWHSTTSMEMPTEDQFVEYRYPVEGCSEVHMIWSDAPCWTVCWNGGNHFIEALRSEKIECVVVQHPWLENDTLFADVILPINTKFEEEDIGAGGTGCTALYLEEQCIEAIGESKSDYEAVAEVARKLGLHEQYTGGKSVKDWIRFGYEASGVADLTSWDELKEKGYFVVPTRTNWENDPPGWRLFYEDPEKHPLETPSGKIEFYSERLAQHFPDDQERPPSPRWIPEGETHQESKVSDRADKYPLLMISNHPRWREHAMHDDVPWLREIPTCKVAGPDSYLYEPVWIHPSVAKQRGIQNGDIVKVFNERGAVLGGAYITERIISGVVYQDHGARIDLITDGLDRGGSNNLIAPTKTVSKNCTGMATSGFLVQVEKVTPAQMKEWMKQYPEAFNKDYNSDYGPVFSSWVEE